MNSTFEVTIVSAVFVYKISGTARGERVSKDV
jgi:hypothetical protein